MEARELIGYMLSDGHGNYIRFDGGTGKYVPVPLKKAGFVWNDRAKANKILKNSLAKELKKKYSVVVSEIEEAKDEQPAMVDKPTSLEVPVTTKVVEKPRKKINKIDRSLLEYVADESGMEQIERKIEDMIRFSTYVQSRQEILNDELSKVDREISDIHHFIEFECLNAYQGWVVYKLLQKKLLKRRSIKDEIMIAGNIMNSKIDYVSLNNVSKSIKGLEHRMYKPRELSDLFA